MSRLTDKIEKVSNEVNKLQDYLEELEERQYKRGAKKRKKQWRKKYANDPIFRMRHCLMNNIQTSLYKEAPEISKFLGLLWCVEKTME